ncbi:hypothetical protein BDF14DRAFT_1731130 [Spinellus fusiger]|nr:hypothetical protein BDF14DRAFT_1731130 [Spinellus fusiger]
MSQLNRPEDIPEVYRLAEQMIDISDKDTEGKETDKTQVVMRLKDAILKSNLATGFPKSINSMQALSSAIPETIQRRLPTTPIRTIYGQYEDRVFNQMYSSYPDLAQAALQQVYGTLLSDTTLIGARETSLLVVVALKLSEQPLQFKSHWYGALNTGSTREEVDSATSVADLLHALYSSSLNSSL